MSHDDLARSLADHLRGPARMVWCDIQLGPVGSIRPDVYAIYKSFVHPAPTAYECKVSQSDFRADVTTGKWQTYLRVACGVYFACEAGLISKSDVPAHCGLIVLKDGRWRATKKATLSPVTVPQDALLKLLIDGVEREGPKARRAAWSEMARLHDIQARFGNIVSKTICDRVAVEQEIASAHYTAERVVDQARAEAARLVKDASGHLEPLRVELCKMLGLPETAHRYDIEHKMNELRAAQRGHPAVTRLGLVASSLRHVLAQIEQDEAHA